VGEHRDAEKRLKRGRMVERTEKGKRKTEEEYRSKYTRIDMKRRNIYSKLVN
jgi:hypothetical protein